MHISAESGGTGWPRANNPVMEQRDTDDVVYRIEITGDLDRHAVESLRLEVSRLAKRYELAIKNFRFEEEGSDA